jgi:nitrite reductase (NADH) large subunit
MKSFSIRWTWYDDNGVTLHTGWTVTAGGPRQTLMSACTKLRWREGGKRLMTACFWPRAPTLSCCPLPGKDLQGVLAYRDIADTQAMIDAAKQYQHAVVIGGGLLGSWRRPTG